jgi:plastocyanin
MYRMLIIGATAAVAATVAAAALGQGNGATATKLKGTVGPGYTISLTKAGKKVKTLKPGMYTISVTDRSPMHNFTLEKETKPNIEKHVTATGFTGTKTITVKLVKGHWKYYCSVHEPQMYGWFWVR